MKYEVTIKFKHIPWYTGIAEAASELEATILINRSARDHGFSGANSGVEVIEIKGEV